MNSTPEAYTLELIVQIVNPLRESLNELNATVKTLSDKVESKETEFRECISELKKSIDTLSAAVNKPPWWKSRWAYIIAAAILSGGVGGGAVIFQRIGDLLALLAKTKGMN